MTDTEKEKLAIFWNYTYDDSTKLFTGISEENIRSGILDEVHTLPPSCVDLLLFWAKSDPASTSGSAGSAESPSDELMAYYDDYFQSGLYNVFKSLKIKNKCSEDDQKRIDENALKSNQGCIPSVCTIINGKRAIYGYFNGSLYARKFFAGDIQFLYHFESMGVFEIMARLINDYSTKGEHPFKTGSPEALLMEVLFLNMKNGSLSTLKGREILYRRGLGFTTGINGLDVDCETNTAYFDQYFRFVQTALKYYDENRVVNAIQGASGSPFSNVASVQALKEIVNSWQEECDKYMYGGMYKKIYDAIVYLLAGLFLINKYASIVGVPSSYTTLSKIIPEVYDIVVGKESRNKLNRYLVLGNLAKSHRELAVQLEIMDIDTMSLDTFETWIKNDLTEATIELIAKYTLDWTGIDLGKDIDNLPYKAS